MSHPPYNQKQAQEKPCCLEDYFPLDGIFQGAI